MSWIKIIGSDEAQGELKESYRKLLDTRGKISNIMAVQSLNPGALERHLDLYVHLMFGRSGLSRAERESIAIVVSAANDCAYCVSHHADMLSRYEKDNALLQQMLSDVSFMALPDRRAALLRYAYRLTTAPGDVRRQDVESLREVGLNDDDILDANLIVAYFNFVNRIALGLGVDYSDDEITGYKDE